MYIHVHVHVCIYMYMYMYVLVHNVYMNNSQSAHDTNTLISLAAQYNEDFLREKMFRDFSFMPCTLLHMCRCGLS